MLNAKVLQCTHAFTRETCRTAIMYLISLILHFSFIAYIQLWIHIILYHMYAIILKATAVAFQYYTLILSLL